MDERVERKGGGISHTFKEFVTSHSLLQIWQEIYKQSVPLNDDNSASSIILQGVGVLSPSLQRFQ